MTREDVDMEGGHGVRSDRRPQSGQDYDYRACRTNRALPPESSDPWRRPISIVDMIIQNISQAALTDISFTVPRADLKKAVPLIQRRSAKDIEAKSVAVTEAIAKVSLIGVGHAVAFRRGGENVRRPLSRGGQYHDDQHLGDQNLLCHRRKISRTRHAVPPFGVRSRSGAVLKRAGQGIASDKLVFHL